jgi:hypothetical protein
MGRSYCRSGAPPRLGVRALTTVVVRDPDDVVIQPRLVDPYLAIVGAFNLALINVIAEYLVTHLGHADAGNEAHIARAEDCYSHIVRFNCISSRRLYLSGAPHVSQCISRVALNRAHIFCSDTANMNLFPVFEPCQIIPMMNIHLI